MKLQNLGLSLFILFFPFLKSSFAQEAGDTTIRGKRLEFYQIYEPEVETPRKTELQASLPKNKLATPPFSYTVPQQTLSYTYNSVPIRPLALGRIDKTVDFQNYAQLGLGNRTGLFVDLGMASIRDKDYQANVHIKHFSQRVNAKQQVDANTDVKLGGVYHFENHDLNANIFYQRNGLRYYGYNQEQYTIDKENNKQAYTSIGFDIGLKNSNKELVKGLNYHPQFLFQHYQDKWKHIDRKFIIHAPLSYSIDEEMEVSLDLKADLVSFEAQSYSAWDNLLGIKPRFAYDNERVGAQLAVNIATNTKGDVYFLPDLYGKLYLFENSFQIHGGWKANVIQNTFERLSKENPFIFGLDNALEQTKTDQIFLGFKGALKPHFTYGAQVNWRQWNNMPMFLNDYIASSEGRLFTIQQLNKVQAIQPEAFVHFKTGPNFGVKSDLSYTYYYSIDGADAVLHLPTLKWGLQAEAQLWKGFSIEGGIGIWNGMYALDHNGNREKMQAFVDINARAEYVIHPRWSAFINLNNLLNTPYQRWYQYDQFGFNFLTGVRFKF